MVSQTSFLLVAVLAIPTAALAIVAVPDDVAHVISPSGIIHKHHEAMAKHHEVQKHMRSEPPADDTDGQSLAQAQPVALAAAAPVASETFVAAAASQPASPPQMQPTALAAATALEAPATAAEGMPASPVQVNLALPAQAALAPEQAALAKPAQLDAIELPLPMAALSNQGMLASPTQVDLALPAKAALAPEQAAGAKPAQLDTSGLPLPMAAALPPLVPFHPAPLPPAAAPVMQTVPAGGLPATVPAATAPAATAAVAIPAAPQAVAATPQDTAVASAVKVATAAKAVPADPQTIVANPQPASSSAAAPSTPAVPVSGEVSGVLPSKGNATNLDDQLIVHEQKRTPATHVLMFGLSVTMALFSFGFLACLLQGRRYQEKRQLADPTMPMTVATPATDAPAADTDGTDSLPLGAEAMHERDVLPTAGQAPTASLLTERNLESCW